MLNVWKPWYLYRPQQLVRRAAGFFKEPQPRYASLRTAWGLTMVANPTEHIGRCLQTTGVYDLSVSEILFRLIRPGDLVIDAGANIGYMALIGAVAAGESGHVIAVEPNPGIFSSLRNNVGLARARIRMAPVDLRQSALGAYAHQTSLVIPNAAECNDGLAYVGNPHAIPQGWSVIDVAVETVDDMLGARHAGLLKIDVEGYECQLLQGAKAALADRRIRHIVFEDHHGPASEAAQVLETAGYALFKIGWSMRRPLLARGSGRAVAARYEAPSYLATLEPGEAIHACERAGWQSLRKQTRVRAAG